MAVGAASGMVSRQMLVCMGLSQSRHWSSPFEVGTEFICLWVGLPLENGNSSRPGIMCCSSRQVTHCLAYPAFVPWSLSLTLSTHMVIAGSTCLCSTAPPLDTVDWTGSGPTQAGPIEASRSNPWMLLIGPEVRVNPAGPMKAFFGSLELGVRGEVALAQVGCSG